MSRKIGEYNIETQPVSEYDRSPFISENYVRIMNKYYYCEVQFYEE